MTEFTMRPGVGIYQRAEAARLLRITPGRLYRWIGGYTYWLRRESPLAERRHQTPIIHSDLPVLDRTVALSFLELMELRVVKALVDEGVTLQYVRKAARVASSRFGTEHPFASQRVLTDGRAIFSAAFADHDVPDLVRWEAGRIDQLISGKIVEPSLHEIDFDPGTSLAMRWRPKGRGTPIVLDPRISFGAPVIEGTAVRTTIVTRLASHTSASEAAVAFELELRQVDAAIEFEAELAAA